MPSPKYQVYNLLETYHELGEYQFKIVLNPRFYKTGHEFKVELFDSSRKPMKGSFEIWGRKINVKFVIDPDVSDGIAFADIIVGNNQLGRVNWWIVKP